MERGTVLDGVGDPQTPGWTATDGDAERLAMNDDEVLKRFPTVASMPISAETADVILGSLEGSRVPHLWRDNDLVGNFNRVGPGPTFLNFTYQVSFFIFLDHLIVPFFLLLSLSNRICWMYILYQFSQTI